MLEQDKVSRMRATIEEELGTFRHFADLPASEIEDMTARIMRALSSFLGDSREASSESRAA